MFYQQSHSLCFIRICRTVRITSVWNGFEFGEFKLGNMIILVQVEEDDENEDKDEDALSCASGDGSERVWRGKRVC